MTAADAAPAACGGRYLVGQLLSVFGDTALWLAAGIWVKTLTGSNAAAGLVFFAFSLPTVIAPAIGMLVDRVKKRPLLVTTDLALGACVLLLLLVHGRDQAWLIYVVMVFYGIAYGVLGSGESALLREMLPEELLGNANGILQTFRQGIRLVGPVAGAGLFAWKGGGVVAIVDACTFVVAAAATFSLHVTEVKPEPSEHHWLTDMTAGVRHVWNTTVLRQMLIACLIVILPFGFYETIAFAVVGNGLHRPPTFLGVLATVQGVGAIAGGLTAGAVMKRTNEGALFGLGCVMFTACSLLLIVPTIPIVIIGVVIIGASLPWILVGLYTLTQRRTPMEIQGRVYSAFDTLIGVPQTVSIAAGAGLIALVDYRLLLGSAAVMSAVSAAYLLTRKEQWRRPPGPGSSPAQEPPYLETAEAVILPIA
ncbi:MAG: MFS transporter [Candidatus Dormiibacterota bacterium]